MMRMFTLKILMTMSLSAALAACGGGSTTTTQPSSGPAPGTGVTASTTTGTVTEPGTVTELGTCAAAAPATGPRVDSAFASSAMYVPAGQGSKCLSLAMCKRESDNAPVNLATVVVQANGDMVFSGAIGTTTIAEIARVNFAETTMMSIQTRGIPSNNTVFRAKSNTKDMFVNSGYSGGFFYDDSALGLRYDCKLSAGADFIPLEQPLSAARVISNIVTGSTGTAIVSTTINTGSYTVTGSIVSWDTGRSGTYGRFASFNLDTAQFGQGNGLNASNHTPISLAIPASRTQDFSTGDYGEDLSNASGTKSVTFSTENIAVRYQLFGSNSPMPNRRQFRMFSAADLGLQ